ncbi:MAG TPA: EAL domain-containing protein [Coriobacteriia bacterium]|nr:EAL domain-containing protein [Coriobacteriia bacterium]
MKLSRRVGAYTDVLISALGPHPASEAADVVSANDLQAQTVRRKLAERAQAASEQRYRSLLENLNDTVLLMEPGGTISFISQASKATFGIEPIDAIGNSLGNLLGEEAAESVRRQLERTGPTDECHTVVKWHSADGRSLDVEIILTPLESENGRMQGILRDITARRQVENQLLHLASHDFLTGLYNRRRFEEELERSLSESRRRGSAGAVLWLDLDGFKDVNDTLGHKAGDELLVRVARRLSSSVRAESIAARLGGDEFAVLLPEADEAEALAAAQRLLADIAEVRVEVEGRMLRASASFGIVLYPQHGITVEDVLSRADVAMYRAKDLGRGRCQLFDPGDDWRSAVEDRRVWIEMVEMALAEDSLVVYAQPINDISTSRCVSYELLVRMADLDGAVILPEHFLPLAERTGIIVDIDLWIMKQAVELLRLSPDDGFRLNINVSPRTLSDPLVLPTLASLLTEDPLDASRLTVEITETAIIVDILSAHETLQEIKRLGCLIALDDFGSGFTSFLHLKQLPIDDIKIDGSFVERIGERLSDQHLVRAMVEMAKGLNMHTTAEFVDSAESLELLRKFGVDKAQGYVIGRPRPAREILDSE